MMDDDDTIRRSDRSASSADIRLEIMPQLSELRDARDDWTGKSKTEERRRIQNRLSQRTYRRRKKLHNASIAAESASWDDRAARSTPRRSTGEPGILMIHCPKNREIAYSFLSQVQRDLSLRAMQPTHLPALIRFNVFSALGHNGTMLGFDVDGLCQADTISPFNRYGPTLPEYLQSVSSCPESLRPTAIQLSITHHPWLDLFPFPRMRDTMIQGAVSGIFDEDELCFDIAYIGDGCDAKRSALLVWGDSWDAKSWEVSVEFLQKWGWLIRGCPEIIESTNLWRHMRGEKPLIVKL